ncbi:MAG: TonB-dependent receptor [Saprospiraceae bacterium]|nr:TonB-dependent receptor [Saprospiraceae bacterium]
MKKTPYLRLILVLVMLMQQLYTGQYLFSQVTPGPGAVNREAMNTGRFYGRVVDENGKGVAYAAVSLFRTEIDSISKTPTEVLISGQITDDHGDFSLEKLPTMGEFDLKISFLGYAEISQKVSFGIGRPNGQGQRPNGGARPGADPSRMADKVDVDLGNINLMQEASNLEQITVTGEATNVQLALDRKIYRVDKDANAAGGTAVEALKNVPSLAVDLDGNLSLRNASPQLFVDGRPTTLSLDQISADAIETVEVITNPSAKFDASGGQAGIVNIVLKKERRIGYNGNVRTGFDSQGSKNISGDINLREGEVNTFISGNYSQRRGKSYNTTDRQNLFGSPLTNIHQEGSGNQEGFFANIRGGIDWFMDNRNTVTVQGSYMRGQFGRPEILNVRTDSLYSTGNAFSEYIRNTDGERNFRNSGASFI